MLFVGSLIEVHLGKSLFALFNVDNLSEVSQLRSQFIVEVKHQVKDNVVILAILGEVDLYSAPMLVEEADTFIKKGFNNFLLDLRDCEAIDSTGLGACIQIMKMVAPNKGKIRLAYANAAITRTFTLAKLKKMFGFYASVQEGLADMA